MSREAFLGKQHRLGRRASPEAGRGQRVQRPRGTKQRAVLKHPAGAGGGVGGDGGATGRARSEAL